MNGHDAGGHDASRADGGVPSPAAPRAQQRFGARLGPIVMAVLFFAVLTPIGVILRIAGRDPLRLHPRRDAASYWLPVAARGRGR